MALKNGYTDLKQLPREHPMRNAPLHVIAARKRWIKPAEYPRSYWNGWTIDDGDDIGPWKYIRPSWRIAGLCFNDLGEVWLNHWEWEGREPLAAPSVAEYPSRP